MAVAKVAEPVHQAWHASMDNAPACPIAMAGYAETMAAGAIAAYVPQTLPATTAPANACHFA